MTSTPRETRQVELRVRARGPVDDVGTPPPPVNRYIAASLP